MNNRITTKGLGVSAVIVAAGMSHRMQGCDKKMVALMGTPVIVHTTAVFQYTKDIDEIVVVTRRQDIDCIRQLLCSHGFSKVAAVVEGGATRQSSVFAGIAACSPQSRYFAIHDGARPLVSSDLIAQTVAAAQQYGAAAPGVAVKETIKIMDRDGFIQQTPPRDTLCVIQTPQIFERSLYYQAIAATAGQDFTDDCQLAEYAGFQVFVTQGEYTNIKITTPQDTQLCEAILRKQINKNPR